MFSSVYGRKHACLCFFFFFKSVTLYGVLKGNNRFS